MTRILLTGASGFAGPAIASRLVEAGHELVAAGRRPPPAEARAHRHVPVADQTASTDWSAALQGIDVIVHLAGHAHAGSRGATARRLIHGVNVEGTEALAQQAAARGVRRFVFMSSIKVLGEESTPGRPHRPEDPPAPGDAYGESKAEAERRLRAVAAATGLELVVIRPPLLIGPRSKANVARLVQLVRSGLPLPFASIRNRRSLLSLPNLADLVAISIAHPRATELPLLAADADAPSTAELVRWVASALGRSARLFPFPPALLESVATPFGLRALVTRLTRSQELDYSATSSLCGWLPRIRTASTLQSVLDPAPNK
ncbi:MAG: NAD-dependent epimerase/dehydratase family protein [Steroidobacteraceae bacterium]